MRNIDYRLWADTAAGQYGLDPAVYRQVVGTESAWDPNAVSPAGAVGLAQLMPGTADYLGVDPNDPYQNLAGGAKYLDEQAREFNTVGEVLAAYNAGPGAVRKHNGIPPYKETQNYVSKITQALGIPPDAPVSELYKSAPVKRNNRMYDTTRLLIDGMAGAHAPLGSSSGKARFDDAMNTLTARQAANQQRNLSTEDRIDTALRRAAGSPLFNIGMQLMSNPNWAQAVQEGLGQAQEVQQQRIKNALQLHTMQQGPEPTSLQRNLIAAGFEPGTPEYESFMRGLLTKPATQITMGGETKVDPTIELMRNADPQFIRWKDVNDPSKGYLARNPAGGIEQRNISGAKEAQLGIEEKRGLGYITSLDYAMDSMRDILKDYSPTGISGLIGSVLETVPGFGQSVMNLFRTNDQNKFRSVREGMTSTLTKLKNSGAASDQDMARMEALVPNWNDGPEVARFKMEQLVREIDALRGVYGSERGVVQPSGDVPQQTAPVTSPSVIDARDYDELFK